jgi:hypothetical protein
MSTPVTAPLLTSQPEGRPARPRFTSRKSVRSVATAVVTLAASIGVGALVHSHDAQKAIDEFITDVRDEPGIESVREVPAPEGYTGKLEINGGAALVTFNEQSNDVLMSSEIKTLDDIVRVDAAIAHAAEEAGFDQQD